MSHADNSADARTVARLISPMCLDCGTPMRLASITPHDRRDDSEIRVYACDCGKEVSQTVRLPVRAIIPAP
jgi:hypothetical protein